MNWQKFQKYFLNLEQLGFSLDISRVNFADDFFDKMSDKTSKALSEMAKLESGAISNPDEKRMVGHYWLRNSSLAPSKEIKDEIDGNIAKILAFAQDVHSGKIQGSGGKFENILCIGIGGSALGPEFVSDALARPLSDKMKVFFLDNTDPDGMDLVFQKIGRENLGKTLAIIASKSGGTPEPRNSMLEAIAKYEEAGLDFAKHAVVTTGKDSKLYKFAKEKGYLEFFPMWDWVGGRTSEFAAVGLLPAALQGIDIHKLLEGAKAMDEATRNVDIFKNPAMLLSLMWYFCTDGKGKKDMVVLPYKDRLLLFSRYLQQLIMESLGKEKDLDGNIVEQGITVYGNKGSTDQHAYVQQLRDGVNNFFITFIEVLKDRDGKPLCVEPDITAGDYLQGFLLGTREALSAKGRNNITITVNDVSERTIGELIALFDRATGFYASFVNINAYHQPGVEAGKKAAAGILETEKKIIDLLASKKSEMGIDEIAQEISLEKDKEIIFKLLTHLTANSCRGVKIASGKGFQAKYKFEK